jgi:hypothetical protein
MRWSKRSLIVFGLFYAPFLLLTGAFMIYEHTENTRVAEFYDAHPMLREMGGGKAGEQMTAILLHRVPIGSTRSDALDVLSAEDMDCKPGDQSGKPYPLKPEIVQPEVLVCHPVKVARTRRVPAW